MSSVTSTFEDKQDYTAIHFTSGIQLFHRELSKFNWKKNIPGCLFIRDFENLPVSSSFDIDLMANEESWPLIIDVFQSVANDCNLVCFYRTSQGGLFILIFDVGRNECKRTWSYYEVRKELPFTSDNVLTANDIEVVWDNGLPIPTKSWQFLLFLHQGLRKGKIDKYKASLENMFKENSNVQHLCNQYLGLSENDIQTILNKTDDLEKWRVKTNIRYAVGKNLPCVSIISRFKKKLANKFYAFHIRGPLFFTLHGPDGVGKTTILEEISNILDAYPFSHEVFHHITSWKRKCSSSDNIESLNKSVVDNEVVSFWRKIIRVVYRNLPHPIQEIWIHSSNYIKYSSNLNRHILNCFYNHKVIVCDRYIYDLWAKHQVASGYLKILHPLHYFYCKALRFPTRAFIITDEASEIYKRKQELSQNQITHYQMIMNNIINRLGLPNKQIAVSGRLPKEIAQEIVGVILEDIDPDVFSLIREEVAKVKLEVKA